MSAQFRDYYQTLGVSKSATQAEVKTAFRKLARQHHPDTAKDKKVAEEKFKEINEAYEVLGDPEKRKRYDEFGADWQHGPQARAGSQRPPGGGFGGKAEAPPLLRPRVVAVRRPCRRAGPGRSKARCRCS